MVRDEADVLPGVAEVGKVGALRVEAVLVGRPPDGVGDAVVADVRVLALDDVVAAVRLVARVRDAARGRLDAVRRLVSGKT